MILSTSLTFSDIDHFQEVLLNKYKKNPSNWKGVKPLTLYNEWKNGECIFEEKDNDIIRKVHVVSIHCFHTNQSGEKFKLIEEKQIMPDGSIRERKFQFVSETMKRNEDLEIAARRALREELQIDDPEIKFERMTTLDEDKTKESTTYVGLKTHYLVYHFKTAIPTRLFKEQYEEVEENITTIFSWKKV